MGKIVWELDKLEGSVCLVNWDINYEFLIMFIFNC